MPISKGLLIFLAVTLSCSKEAPQETIAALLPVTRIDVIPVRAAVYPGETQQLSAVTKDANGVMLDDRPVTWSSSDTSIAKIDGSGLVRAARPGDVTLFATSEGATGSSALWVMPAPPPPGQIARIDVIPVGAYLKPGETLQLTAVAKDVTGQVLTGGPVIWTSRNTTIMTVTSNGLVTAVRVGKDAIDATIDGKSGHTIIEVTIPPAPVATVEVSPANATVQIGSIQMLSASMKDANGNVLIGRTVTWSTSNPAIASVASSGAVRGLAAGNVTITATSEGKTGTSSITVQ